MTIKEIVEEVKKNFNEDRKTHSCNAYYHNGYMQALDDVLKAENCCDGDKVTDGINKDGIIRDLEADIHRLKCEKEDLINHNEDLDIYLDELKNRKSYIE